MTFKGNSFDHKVMYELDTKNTFTGRGSKAIKLVYTDRTLISLSTFEDNTNEVISTS